MVLACDTCPERLSELSLGPTAVAVASAVAAAVPADFVAAATAAARLRARSMEPASSSTGLNARIPLS
eukprot:6206372-Pleurochrysis_carterae.AAC.3